MREAKLTTKQKDRLRVLEPKLKFAIINRDFETAQSLVVDIQDLLRPTGNFNRLIQSKNRLYELAIDCNKVELAISGLVSNRKVVSSNTRLYLESSALLAIAYLRKNDIDNAKPLIKEVLQNDIVIKTSKTRAAFRSAIIQRFDEEVALNSLKDMVREPLDECDLEPEIIRAITTQNEDEIFENIGRIVPQKSKYLLYEVHEFSLKQLPSAERLALPSPNQKVKDAEVGKTVFASAKRVVYNSICNPKSDIYKSWFNNGMQVVLSKGYITAAVTSAFVDLGLGVRSVIIWIVALIIKFGLEVYCERFKPLDLMNLRE